MCNIPPYIITNCQNPQLLKWISLIQDDNKNLKFIFQRVISKMSEKRELGIKINGVVTGEGNNLTGCWVTYMCAYAGIVQYRIKAKQTIHTLELFSSSGLWSLWVRTSPKKISGSHLIGYENTTLGQTKRQRLSVGFIKLWRSRRK